MPPYSEELLRELITEAGDAGKRTGTDPVRSAAGVANALSNLMVTVAELLHAPDSLTWGSLRDATMEMAGALLEMAQGLDPELREQILSEPRGADRLLSQLPDLSENWCTETSTAACVVEWCGSVNTDLSGLIAGATKPAGHRGAYVRDALVLVRDMLDLAQWTETRGLATALGA